MPTQELGPISEVLHLDSGAGETGTEVVAYEDGRLYSTNAALGRIDIWDLATGARADTIDLAGLRGFDGVQSVAVKNGIVAAAIARPDAERTVLGETVTAGRPGFVALFDAETGELIDRVPVGNLPDMLTFTPDGSQLLVANEGEFNSEAGLDRDPVGSVSIISLADPTDITVDDRQLLRLRRPRGPGARRGHPARARAVDAARARARIHRGEPGRRPGLRDAAGGEHRRRARPRDQAVVDLLPLGTVDHGAPGNELDPNDDGVIDIASFDVQRLRMPDAIASFATGGATYFVTANEGDGRGDAGDLPDGDEARVGDIAAGEVTGVALDPSIDITGLERLAVSTIDGDTDGDGDIDVLTSFGGRGFTIFDADGEVVFESGSQFERIIAEVAPERFNDDEGGPDENRSDAKGSEPEAVALGEIDGEIYAFIGLERDSGVMIYNVTDPANAAFVDYISGFDFGNVSPETIAFIPGSETASRQPADRGGARDLRHHRGLRVRRIGRLGGGAAAGGHGRGHGERGVRQLPVLRRVQRDRGLVPRACP